MAARLGWEYHFAAGSMAGAAQAVFACPFELLKIIQQVNSTNKQPSMTQVQIHICLNVPAGAI